MKTQLGYACINMQLRQSGIGCNRGMIKKTFSNKGFEYAGELALLNLKDLIKIIKWNVDNNFHVYRMSSSIFPWMSEYDIQKIPNFNDIELVLKEIGTLVLDLNHRLSFHPGPFNVLASPNDKMVINTIKDLDQHTEIMDIIGLPQTVKYPINIHIGGSYGNKELAMQRFCSNFKKLSKSTQQRLVVENDDKGSMFSVKDLHDGIYQNIGIPITFDYHHHRFCTGGLDEKEAILLASTTWPSHIRQLTHYSSCRKTFEEPSQKAQAHADYIYEIINDYGLDLDIEIEAKMKELSVIKYREDLENGVLLDKYLNL